MPSPNLSAHRYCAPLCTLALAIGLCQPASAGPEKSIDEHHAADPQGTVEIVNVAGSVEVIGWERAEVEVTGTVGAGVDRVDVEGSGDRTAVRVVLRPGHGPGNSDARLKVHVPVKSSLKVALVSADLKLAELQGDLKLQTVSGDIEGDTGGGDVQLSSVSGDVRMSAPAAKNAELKTISGDIDFKGGDGNLEVTTVSGDVKVAAGTISRGRFKSVSGDMSTALALTADGQLDGETVSGDLRFDFATIPAADFDVQTLSGDIDNCFGPKASESRYGPGSRLTYKNGDGRARVHLETRSGGIHLCTVGSPRHSQTATNSRIVLAACQTVPVRYVF